MYKRAEYQTITSRLKEPRKFIQVVMPHKFYEALDLSGEGELHGHSEVLSDGGIAAA